MAVTKRNNKKEEKNEVKETKNVEKTSSSSSSSSSSKQCKNCQGCQGCQILKSIGIIIITALIVISCSLLYIKQYKPNLYSKRVEVFFPSSHSSSIAKEATTNTNTNTNTNTETKTDKVKKAFDFNEIEDYINLEEKAFLKDMFKEEEIFEKLKDRPDLLQVHNYYEEPIGQLVKRLSLESQIVIFINSNDERSKVTRLAISQVQVPYGIIEVDNEPRGGEMREALFRMTSQRTFPFIYVNGKFFGNSFYLQKMMKNGEFYKMVDSEENKAEWLQLKQEYKEKVEERKKKDMERRQKKLEKIMKKIEEGKKARETKQALPLEDL
ncbi:hypothetical protein BCR32DRAFT_290288 [Anaeromyces robustus]|uniref:Glutaredoxin domain-containing protein n=1 Tax=Anaeromyces robustus TaxID=1754192 RepID=A0A1Y1XK21_9FUNG|nr:hypothetical protein BCR32DRAFT_290288 [Anaeromyces robustus]|eukprot:ORX86062.1 hypothetical protein BCR32DRAFT_290288 [Anaeromyces robustus]